MSSRLALKRTVQFVATLVVLGTTWDAAGQKRTESAPRPATTASESAELRCGDVLSFEILLDRQGFSPGEIDGKRNANFLHALAALQAVRNLPATGEPDCATWHALGGETSGPIFTTYVVTAEDVKGPFARSIPRSIAAQATLPRLHYRSALEMLAERFHISPALLQQRNPRRPIAAGRRISVPAVWPFDAVAKPSPDPAAKSATVSVSKGESALRVTGVEGELLFFAPVTTGGEHDPLPIGVWKVTGVDWYPVFHYNPNLFWDAKARDQKATIKAGPNNPVGVVWIDLDREHYGIHGTPEPSRIAQSESHGCVRLTNWDAARVASLVQPGTRVEFK